MKAGYWDKVMANNVSAETVRNAQRRVRSAGGSWQAEKSHMMRTHILDATMACLIHIGYSNTTTEKIARQAGVSRGAMTHHFKCRADVFSAAAEHITDIRVAEYDSAIKKVSEAQGSFPTFESMRQTLKVLQQYFMEPSFIAYQELVRGARTDEYLGDVMKPLQDSLDHRISESMVTRFPIWSEAGMVDTGEVLRDLIMHSLQGVALDPSPYIKSHRLDRLHDFLAKIAMDAFTTAYIRAEQVGAK